MTGHGQTHQIKSRLFIKVATTCWISGFFCLLFITHENAVPSEVGTAGDLLTLVHVVYAADDSSIPGVEASIRSLREHASEPVAVHFIGSSALSVPDVTFIRLSDVSERYNLKRFVNDAVFDNLVDLNSVANYARFVLPSLFPTLTKVLWMDADTLVKCDVVPFVREALSKTSHGVAAVPRSDVWGIEQWYLDREQITIRHSFNAGVSVMDLQRWRQRRLSQTIYNFVRLNREKSIYHFGSQPPLNLAIRDNFEHMSPRWNVDGLGHREGMNTTFLKEEACLLHWTGEKKPWLPDGLYKELWHPGI